MTTMMTSTTGARTLLAAVLLAACTAAARAETVSFDLPSEVPSGAFVVAPSQDFYGDAGAKVTVTSFTTPGSGANAAFETMDPSLVVLSDDGLGVTNERESLNGVESQLDGFEADEVLQFLFPMPVRLSKVFFSQIDEDDEFDFAISLSELPADAVDADVNATFGDDNLLAISTQDGPYRVVDFGSMVTFNNDQQTTRMPDGRVFQFYTNNSNDDYKIAKVEFKTSNEIDPNEAPIIPEPCSAVLLASGLAIVASRSRVRAAG